MICCDACYSVVILPAVSYTHLNHATMLFKIISNVAFFVAVWRVDQCLTEVLCYKVESKKNIHKLINYSKKHCNLCTYNLTPRKSILANTHIKFQTPVDERMDNAIQIPM